MKWGKLKMTEEKDRNVGEGLWFSYERVEDELIASYQVNQKMQEQKIIYSKHNCEVLDYRIERGLLEQKKLLLKRKERIKKINRAFLLLLVFLNFLFIGNMSMAMLMMNFYMLPNMFLTLAEVKQSSLFIEQRLACVEALKEGKIELTEEELALLNASERACYEKSGELTIGNMNEVCNQKILKRRFGKKNG